MDIKISYKRDLNHSYILFSGGVIETENYQVQMVLHRLLPGLLPCCVYSLDNQQVWCCENTSTQKLSVYCQIHVLGMEELMWIYGNLLKNLQELQEYLIDLNTIYLTPDELYVDPFTYRVLCCQVPFYEKDIWESLLELSQYLLGFLNQQDSDAVTLAYGIFRYLSQGGSSLEVLWTMLYGRQAENPVGRQGLLEDDGNWMEPDRLERQDRYSNGVNKAEKQSRYSDGVNGLEKLGRYSDGVNGLEKLGRYSDGVNGSEKLGGYSDGVNGLEKLGRHSDGVNGSEKLGRHSDGVNRSERRGRHFDGVNGLEKLGRHSDELSVAERQKIAKIDLEMEQQRQRDLDAIFKQKEDFTKRKWKWKWPAWLCLRKRGKQEASMEDILFSDNGSADFGLEQEMIGEMREKKTFMGKVMEKEAGTWGKNSSMQPRCDDRQEEYEETEEGTTLLSVACGKVQAVLIHDYSKERYVLEAPVVVIGKMPGAVQLVLKEATVSRIHARIICLEEGNYLEDMNSKNGTYINGELLESQKRVKLESGDKICFADVPYTYLE